MPEDTGNGEVVMKKWVYLIGKIIMIISVGGVMAYGGFRAYDNAMEVPEVKKDIMLMKAETNTLKIDIATIRTDIKWVCKEMGRKDND